MACVITVVADWFAILRKLVSTSTDSVVSVVLSWIIVHVITVVAIATIVLASVAVALAVLRVAIWLVVAVAVVVAIAVVVADAIVGTVVAVSVVAIVTRTIVTGGSDSRDVVRKVCVDG